MPLPTIDFKSLFEKSPGLFLILDPQLMIVAVTDEYEKATLTKREDILGKNLFEIFPDNPEDKNASGVHNLKISLERVLQSKMPDTMAIQKYDIRLPLSEGGNYIEKYWSPYNTPILNEQGQVIYIIHKVDDVSGFMKLKQKEREQENENKELKSLTLDLDSKIIENGKDLLQANLSLKMVNDQLLVKALELKRSNEELSRFAATASHDIKAPFRSVGGYLQLIKDKLGDYAKDEELVQYFERISSARTRISNLLDDLLRFAQITQSSEPFKEVDVNEILNDVLKNLDYNLKETGAEIIIEKEMPVIKGQQSLILQLFQNLISNGIKFQQKNKPTIVITSKEEDDYYVFSVKDNGIGINEKYFEKIFGVFERLHGQDQYTGSGLGLSICQKIVHQHGGKIWVESELEKGTTFYFTIPR